MFLVRGTLLSTGVYGSARLIQPAGYMVRGRPLGKLRSKILPEGARYSSATQTGGLMYFWGCSWVTVDPI